MVLSRVDVVTPVGYISILLNSLLRVFLRDNMYSKVANVKGTVEFHWTRRAFTSMKR